MCQAVRITGIGEIKSHLLHPLVHKSSSWLGVNNSHSALFPFYNNPDLMKRRAGNKYQLLLGLAPGSSRRGDCFVAHQGYRCWPEPRSGTAGATRLRGVSPLPGEIGFLCSCCGLWCV